MCARIRKQFNLMLSLLVCLFVRSSPYLSTCLPPLSFVPTVTALQAVQPRVRRNHLGNEIVRRCRQTSRKPTGIKSDLKGLILWMVPRWCVRAGGEDTQSQRAHVRTGSTRAKLQMDGRSDSKRERQTGKHTDVRQTDRLSDSVSSVLVFPVLF